MGIFRSSAPDSGPDERLEEGVGEGYSGRGYRRIVAGHDKELEESRSGHTSVVAGGRADALDEPVERARPVSLENIEVSSHQCRLHIQRGLGSSSARLNRVDMFRAAVQAHHGQTGLSIGIRWIRVEHGPIGGLCGVPVTRFDGFERGFESRIDRGLDRSGLVGITLNERSRHPLLSSDGEQLLKDLADLRLRVGTLEQGYRLALDHCEHRRDRLHLEGRRDLRIRIDINLGKNPSTTVFNREGLEDRRELLAWAAPLRPQVKHDGHGHRLVDDVGLEGGLRHIDDDAGRRGGPGNRRPLLILSGSGEGSEINGATG